MFAECKLITLTEKLYGSLHPSCFGNHSFWNPYHVSGLAVFTHVSGPARPAVFTGLAQAHAYGPVNSYNCACRPWGNKK